MAAQLVKAATSEKLAEMDWTKNIEICELVARDQRQAKDIVKAVKKQLGSRNPNTQLYAVMLLEMLMNNIGENIYKQVIDAGVLPILVKIVKKKTDLPVRERIFLLLDATQTSLGGAAGKFPQYYTSYYDLVSSGVKFPQRPRATTALNPPALLTNNRITLKGQLASARIERPAQQKEPVSEHSILLKACNALEVLKDVLDAVDSQNPEGAQEEFTLDLVEQCSFQKQRVVQLAMASRDEKIVSRAIELNDQLQSLLVRHCALLSRGSTASSRSASNFNNLNHESSRSTTDANHKNHEEEQEEEDPEQIFRRIWKGKACVRVEDEESSPERRPFHLMSSIPSDRLNRPLIRPLPSHPQPIGIPPPPTKHAEREKFFKEKRSESTNLVGHMRGLSLHSHNGSSSRSESTDLSDDHNL